MESPGIGRRIVVVSPKIGLKWNIGKRGTMTVDLRGLRGKNLNAIFAEKLGTGSTSVPR